jgi:hypothetical protein
VSLNSCVYKVGHGQTKPAVREVSLCCSTVSCLSFKLALPIEMRQSVQQPSAASQLQPQHFDFEDTELHAHYNKGKRKGKGHDEMVGGLCTTPPTARMELVQ